MLFRSKSSEAQIEAAKRRIKEHPEAHREAVKRWDRKHPEAHRERVKRWDRKHPEVHRERIKRWRREHPEAAARIAREYYNRMQDEAGCHQTPRYFLRGYQIKKAFQDCKEIVEI